MEDLCLFQPLLPTSIVKNTNATTTNIDTTLNTEYIDGTDVHARSSNSSIFLRVLAVILIGALSIWANYEASKDFDITIINNAKASLAGHKFHLFYVSNDKATRMLLNASDFLENLLYLNVSLPTMQIKHVMIILAGHDLDKEVEISSAEKHDYLITINPSILREADMNYAMASALQHAMARIWLWDNDGEPSIPPTLQQGMVEFISTVAGFAQKEYLDHGREINSTCWEDNDPKIVAQWLSYCEEHKKGFFRQLYQALRDRQRDEYIVDGWIGMYARECCACFRNSCNVTAGTFFEQVAEI